MYNVRADGILLYRTESSKIAAFIANAYAYGAARGNPNIAQMTNHTSVWESGIFTFTIGTEVICRVCITDELVIS